MKDKKLLTGTALLIIGTLLSIFSPTKGVVADSSNQSFTFELNGISLNSDANHKENNSFYVVVQPYLDLLHLSYSLDPKKKTLSLKGKTLDTVIVNNTPTVDLKTLADATGGKLTISSDGKDAYVLLLPDTLSQTSDSNSSSDTSLYSESNSTSGGPIYGVSNGKLSFVEFIINTKDFLKTTSLTNLPFAPGIPLPNFNHADISHTSSNKKSNDGEHYTLLLSLSPHEDVSQNTSGTDNTLKKLNPTSDKTSPSSSSKNSKSSGSK